LIFELHVSKGVQKFLNKRDKKFIERVNAVFARLRENPYNHPELDIKKLINMENDFRVRVGKYRFLYTVVESKILIFVYRADSRGSIYKKQ
jgi:mRNA interferase RelE/StbE